MMRNDRSSGSSSGSSKKGKKSSNSDSKPKQPQRGLGVAQLEKIRLHGQMGCSTYDNLPRNPFETNIQQDDLRGQTGNSINIPSASPFSEQYSSSSISSASSYGFHPNMMIGFNEMERGNIRYGDSQTIRFNPALLESDPLAPNITRPLLNKLQAEDSMQNKRRADLDDYMGSSSQNSGSSDAQELDLELRLSL